MPLGILIIITVASSIGFLIGYSVNTQRIRERDLKFNAVVGYMDGKDVVRISVESDDQEAAFDVANRIRPMVIDKLYRNRGK